MFQKARFFKNKSNIEGAVNSSEYFDIEKCDVPMTFMKMALYKIRWGLFQSNSEKCMVKEISKTNNIAFRKNYHWIVVKKEMRINYISGPKFLLILLINNSTFTREQKNF